MCFRCARDRGSSTWRETRRDRRARVKARGRSMFPIVETGARREMRCWMTDSATAPFADPPATIERQRRRRVAPARCRLGGRRAVLRRRDPELHRSPDPELARRSDPRRSAHQRYAGRRPPGRRLRASSIRSRACRSGGSPISCSAAGSSGRGRSRCGASARCCAATRPIFGTLFAGRMVVGIGEAALAPAAISIIGDLFPPRAARHSRSACSSWAWRSAAVSRSRSAARCSGSSSSGALARHPARHARAMARGAGAARYGRDPDPGAARARARTRAASTMRSLPDAASPMRELAALRRARSRRSCSACACMSIGDFAMLSWGPTLLARRYGLAAPANRRDARPADHRGGRHRLARRRRAQRPVARGAGAVRPVAPRR